MNKELQELRSQNHQETSSSHTQNVQATGTPNSQLTEEDAADDFFLDVPAVSLDNIYLDAGTAVKAFQKYLLLKGYNCEAYT